MPPSNRSNATARNILRVVLCGALVTGWIGAASASQTHASRDERLFAWPRGSVAAWAFDPRGFAEGEGVRSEQQALAEGFMRAALSAGVIDDPDAAAIVSGVLGVSLVASVPHRGHVSSFAFTPDSRGERTLSALALSLDLFTTSDHAAMVRSIKSIAIDAEGQDPGLRQRVVALPDGGEGVELSAEGWPAWRMVRWASRPGRFRVGLGEDALDAAGAVGGAWDLHRAAIDARRAPGDVFFELYADFDAVRGSSPESIARGQIGRLLNASGLGNTRCAMLHMRWVRRPGSPPMIAIDATWESRSDSPGTIGHRALSVDRWPEGVAEPRGANSAIVFTLDWLDALDRARAVYGSTIERDWDRMIFHAKCRRWDARHRSKLERVASASRQAGGWTVLADVPSPPVALPGLTTVFVPLRGSSEDRLEGNLDAVWSSLLGDDADIRDGVRSLRLVPAALDPAGLLRVLAWDITRVGDHEWLVFSWSPGAVGEAIRALGR